VSKEDIVFEGDEFTRCNTRAEEATSVARSSVADFLLRRRVVKSERQARWLAGFIAILAIGSVVLSATWATKTLGATPNAKRYVEMSATERAALPARHRLYLERLQREVEMKKEQELRDKFKAPGAQKQTSPSARKADPVTAQKTND
jgi:hypothetical protein